MLAYRNWTWCFITYTFLKKISMRNLGREINSGRKIKTHWLIYAVCNEAVIHKMNSYVIKMEIKQSWWLDLKV